MLAKLTRRFVCLLRSAHLSSSIILLNIILHWSLCLLCFSVQNSSIIFKSFKAEQEHCNNSLIHAGLLLLLYMWPRYV